MSNFLNPPDTRDRYIATAAQTIFQITFIEGGVLKSPIVVRTLAVGADAFVLQTVVTDYALDRDADTIEFVSGQPVGTVVDIQRGTTRERNITHDPSSTITGAVLNRDEEQSFRFKQELEEANNRTLGLTAREDEFDARNKPICNVGSFPEGRLDCVLNYGDILQLFGEGLISTLGEVDVFYFDGDGTTTGFTLLGRRGSEPSHWQVYKNGVRQYPELTGGDDGVYVLITASGVDDILSFETAPENGAVIFVMSYTGTVIAALLNDSIDTQHILNGAVTMPKLDGGVGAAGRIIFFDAAGVASVSVPVPSDISGFDAQVVLSRLDEMAQPTNAFSMNSQRLTDLPSPSSANDAARKGYIDTRRLDQFAPPNQSVDMGNERLAKLADPTEQDDAATRQYVDDSAGVVIGQPIMVPTGQFSNGNFWRNETGKPVSFTWGGGVIFPSSIQWRRLPGGFVQVASSANNSWTHFLGPGDDIKIVGSNAAGGDAAVYTLLA